MSENAENQIGEQNSSLKEESITTEEKPVADNKPSEIPEKGHHRGQSDTVPRR